MNEIKFSLDVRPVSKQRPRLGKSGNTYTPRKTKKYEKMVALHAKKSRPRDWPLDGVYTVICNFQYPDKRTADVDNLVKAIFDGCNSILWNDDKQVVQLEARKSIGDEERVYVRVISSGVGT